MAGITAVAAVFRRWSPCRPGIVFASAARSSPLGHGKAASRAVHEVVEEAKQTSRVVKEKAKVAADGVAEKASETAQSVKEKAKKAMESACGKASEMKESAAGKAAAAIDAAKNAAKESMKRN